MNCNCENIFKTSRENANLTQERAAELLGVSTKTISNWECYKWDNMEDKKIVKMAKFYNDPTLPLKWLVMHSPFSDYLPPIEFDGKGNAIIDTVDSHNDFDDIAKLLVKVLKDKKVDDHELDDWEKIKRISLKLAGALMSLVAQCDRN